MPLIVKSNDLIQAKYSLTKNEQRLVLYACSLIGKDDEDFRHYEMTLSDMVELTGISKTRVYEEALAMVQELMKKPVTFLKGQKKALVVNWFSSILVDEPEGIVSFSIAPELKPYLLKLKSYFTAYRIECVTGFESKYAFRIYELCKQYETIGNRIFTISELKLLLDLVGKYNKISSFKNKVVEPALIDINTHSDLLVAVEYKKRRKSIEKIVFDIQPKDQAKTAKSKSVRPKPESKPSGPDPVVLAVEKEVERKTKESEQKVAGWKKEWEDLDEEARSNYQGGWLCYLKFKSTGRV